MAMSAGIDGRDFMVIDIAGKRSRLIGRDGVYGHVSRELVSQRRNGRAGITVWSSRGRERNGG